MSDNQKIIFPICLFFLILLSTFASVKKLYALDLKNFELAILNNEVINPLCFSSVTWNKNNISTAIKELTSCEKYKNIPLEQSENFISAEIKREADGIYRGYAQYSVIGTTTNGSVIINLTENGGGTGHFDSVWKIRRKFEWSEKTGKFEDRIHLISLYSGGDRCNGGVYDVHVGRDEKGEYINISSQITAFMFLEQKKPSYSYNYLLSILNKDTENLKKTMDLSISPYTEIANCALCCSGSKISKMYINNDFLVNTYELNKNNFIYGDETELPTQGKYQACFNTMVKNEIDRKKNMKFLSFDEKAAFKFKSNFINNCLSECEKNDQYCLKAIVLVCQKGKPKLSENCEQLVDTRGPYRSEDECLDRVYEIKSELPKYRPNFEAKGYMCENKNIKDKTLQK